MAWAGHNVCTGPFDGYFDVMYTRGALDPLGILTELVPPSAENEEGPVCLRNIQYLSLVAEMNLSLSSEMERLRQRNVRNRVGL